MQKYWLHEPGKPEHCPPFRHPWLAQGSDTVSITLNWQVMMLLLASVAVTITVDVPALKFAEVRVCAAKFVVPEELYVTVTGATQLSVTTVAGKLIN